MVGLPTRYGTYAMEVLINQVLKMGAKRGNLEAKIFGGGNVLRGFTVSNVGQKNSVFVKRISRSGKIPVVAEDLLDVYPRKVYFFRRPAGCWCASSNRCTTTPLSTGKGLQHPAAFSKVEGDVELFD